MRYYPAFIDLAGKKAVVVGGGSVAARKVSTLLKAGAVVTVISPELTAGLRRMVSDGKVSHVSRPYRRGDLKGAFLAVAATDSEEVNRMVAGHAPSLCNVADSPDLSNFIVPSTVDRGDLCIAISTSGASPALARSIRLELERIYGPEFARYLAKLKKLRSKAMESIADPALRRQYLKSLGAKDTPEIIRRKT